jgi:hypothetical protein
VNHTALIQLVDRLEDKADGYVTLAELEAAGAVDVSAAISAGVLLIDHRTRRDGTQVTLCRLNRHHPTVKALTSW